ncbi:hypothetical protein ACFTXM_30855 [Streptomyces sp. NPDC056930]
MPRPIASCGTMPRIAGVVSAWKMPLRADSGKQERGVLVGEE